jgi:hypothetical protein
MPGAPRDGSDDLRRISDEAAQIYESLRNEGNSDISLAESEVQSPKDEPSKPKSEERLKKELDASNPVPDISPPTPERPKIETFIDSLNMGEVSSIESKAQKKLRVSANSDVFRMGGRAIAPTSIETGVYYILKLGSEYWLLPDAKTLEDQISAMAKDPSYRWHNRLFETDMRLASTPGLQKGAKVTPASGGWDILKKGLLTLPQKPAKIIQNTASTDQQSHNPGHGWVALALLSTIVLGALIAASHQGDNKGEEIKLNGRHQNLSGGRDAGPTYANTRIAELEQKHKNAILRCEHEKVIRDGTSLARTTQGDQTRRVKGIVNKSRSSISGLDQPGKWGPYTEDAACTWGSQWFDNMTDTSFRAFVAISGKCQKRILHYSFSDQQDSPPFYKGTVSLRGHTVGEVRLPYPSKDGTFYAKIDSIECN